MLVYYMYYYCINFRFAQLKALTFWGNECRNWKCTVFYRIRKLRQERRYIHFTYFAFSVVDGVEGNFVAFSVVAVVGVCADIYSAYVLR